jgi:hypothetical protein
MDAMLFLLSKEMKVSQLIPVGSGGDPYFTESEWENPVYRKIKEMRYRVRQCINLQVRFLIIYGPPGIGKSEGIYVELKSYSDKLRAAWLAAQPKPERRTVFAEDGTVQFNPPFSLVTGQISFPQFHCAMYRAAYPGEVFFVDDVASVGDRRIQEAIQQASDNTHNGLCAYNFNASLPYDDVPKKYNMRGAIILVTNFRRGHAPGEMGQLFTPALLSRAVEVNFPWDKKALWQYVDRMGFDKAIEKNRGLYRYLRRPSPQDEPEYPTIMQGLGFKGSDTEARKILSDVRTFFLKNEARAQEVSFRVLRKILSDRVNCAPNEWMEYADAHLSDRPSLDPKMDGGSTHAFIERPDNTRR